MLGASLDFAHDEMVGGYFSGVVIFLFSRQRVVIKQFLYQVIIAAFRFGNTCGRSTNTSAEKRQL
jgi:hypothetical protein